MLWKDIPGFEGEYQVSDAGLVRSKRRILKTWGCGYRRRYQMLRLGRDGGKHYVHRLVLITFCGPPPEGTEASHLNGDASDNRLENLRWESKSTNNLRKREHGTDNRGDRHYRRRGKEKSIAVFH